MSAYFASTIAQPNDPHTDFPENPFAFPYSSHAVAPKNATSIFNSPDSTALALPPCGLIITGFGKIPSDIALSKDSLSPLVSVCVITPFLICSVKG